MSNWNFHGYIALPLEEYGKQYIGDLYKSADEIECGEFVNVMLSILSAKYGDLTETSYFVNLCEAYEGVSASQIPVNEVINIFDEFKKLIIVK